MPRYFYKCKYCEVEVDTYHGMSDEDRLKDCEYCDSINCMVRIPTKFLTDKKTNDPRVGDVVRRAIRDFAENLEKEKQSLKSEFDESSS
jgi:hypothetical protein